MKTVLGDIVGLEQAAFIEGRDLFDNSMLTHELAFKYNRSLVSPRCILKVDIKKAFDSVNWSFLADMLHLMEVLSRLLRKLPSYSGFSYHPKCVKINLTHLIFADDLLVFTRGDLLSIQAVDNCLAQFVGYSGLRINPMKSNLYFGGVSLPLKKLILEATGYVEGDLPVRYLGIPLFSSRLTQKMFTPLLDKIKDKLSHWANNMLSYAGKIALINSVIFGLQSFWGASVLLPKGIIKQIQKLCKDFLWGIADGHRRLVFKSWDSICLPRQEGGLNIKEILSWNKTQMMVWARKIEMDTSTIWAKWVKAYILKGTDFWQFHLTSANSWFWHNVIYCRDMLILATGGISQAKILIGQAKFKSEIYELLRKKGASFSKTKTLGDSCNYPKHEVIGVLDAQNRLPTVDNLCKRGLIIVNRCALCEAQSESIHHLLFECSMSAAVWKEVAVWVGATPAIKLRAIFDWYRMHNRGKSWIKRQRRCAFVCAIYLLWKERNQRIFQGIDLCIGHCLAIKYTGTP
ncbi:uncharacterized protein LOC141614024 [Silene latifolia]|uniref:uncharacterized protein LOC141614024 n=1 Tax=Silene latifolia TaxID=37657 RepID=UPI003D775490